MAEEIRFWFDYMMGRFRRVYFMSVPESKEDYKSSRICYSVGDTATQTIAQLAGGAFLVTLMTELGFSDGEIGTVSSIVCLASLMQLFAVRLSGVFHKNKLFVTFGILQQIWFALMFFIPFLQADRLTGKLLFLLCYLFANCVLQLTTPAKLDWLASIVPARLKGKYLSIKDAAAVFVVVTVMLLMGIAVDRFKEGHLGLLFILLGSVTAAFTLLNVAAFSMMHEPRLSATDENGLELNGRLARRSSGKKQEESFRFGEEIRIALANTGFRKALLLCCLWMTVFYTGNPFNASYQVKELHLSYTYIMALSFGASMLRVWLMPKAGKLADRIGMTTVYQWTLLCFGGYYLLMALTVPANAVWMTVFSSLASALSWTFLSTGLFAIQMECVDESHRIAQFAIMSVVSGLYGFLVSLLSGRLLDYLQQHRPVLFGYTCYAQQITNLIGAAAVAVMAVWMQKTFAQKRRRSD